MSTYELVLKARLAENRKLEKKLRIKIREEIFEEVREEVLHESRQQGLEEGRQEGLEMAIERLLRKKFSIEMVSEILEVDPEQVRIIQERLLAADRN